LNQGYEGYRKAKKFYALSFLGIVVLDTYGPNSPCIPSLKDFPIKNGDLTNTITALNKIGSGFSW